MEKPIRTSAKALIIQEGKMAAIQISDGQESWYILPGGGQEARELLPEAACREVAEELGLNVRCGELLFVIEGADGESFHRIDLVFHCEFLGQLEAPPLQGDTNQVGIAWLDIATLNRQPLYPSKLRRPIMNFYQGKPHAVYLGNESIGDPEVTD